MKRLLTIGAAIAALVAVPTAASAQSATPSISLVHGIPGTTVDLVVDGSVVLDAFTPGSIVDITSFAGRTLNDVEVVADDTGDTVIGPIATLDVPATGSWSIVAHLDADGTPMLSSFENDLSDLSTGDARLTLRHTAAAPAIDLVLGDQRPLTNLVNGDSEELELPDGDLADASIAPTGESPIKEIAGVDLAADSNTIVYVVGSVDDDTLDVVLEVVPLPVTTATTTTVAGSTTTTSPTPSAVNTGSPLGGTSTTTLLVIAAGGLVLAGGSYLARRRV